MATLRIRDPRLKRAIDVRSRALHEDYLDEIFGQNKISMDSIVLPYGLKFNQEKKHVYLSLGDQSVILVKGSEYDAVVSAICGFYSSRTGKSVNLDEVLETAKLQEMQRKTFV